MWQAISIRATPSVIAGMRNFFPAKAGMKKPSQKPGELFEACNDGGDPSAARVRERATTERGEAGAENNRRVDEIRVVNDVLAQTRGALIYEY